MMTDLIRNIMHHFAKVATLPLKGGVRRGSLVFLLFFTLISCSSSKESEEDAFPALVTEMGLLRVGPTLTDLTFYTDSGKRYQAATEIEGLKTDTWLRCLAGFVIQDAGKVKLLTLQGVAVLANCSDKANLKRDPVGVVSAWTGGSFVNLHLLKKNKGADHDWGYILDNSYANTAGGTTYEVSLYHDQRNDPTAYSSDIYFSLSQDSLSKTRTTADSILLTVNTFEATPHQWRFALTP